MYKNDLINIQSFKWLYKPTQFTVNISTRKRDPLLTPSEPSVEPRILKFIPPGTKRCI